MRILALDSSGLVAGVAVLESENEKKDAQTIAEYTVNYKKTHSQTLLPMLDEIVKMTELDLDTIDAIAIASGPGSFTGLRIGSATAKGLGLALKKPLVEVPTLEGLAYNLCGTEGLICPIMDARRGQVYTGIYACADNELKVMEEQMAVPIEELAEKLKKYNIKFVTHIIIGLPEEKEDDPLDTAIFSEICGTWGIKIHLLHIIKNTELEKYYKENELKIQKKDEYVKKVVKILQNISYNIVIHRLTGDGNKETLEAPLWSLNKRDVLNSIEKEMKMRNIYQGGTEI